MLTTAICITLNNSLILKIYFPRCLFFKNYSLVEFIYLLIRCSKTNFFLWNINNTYRNGINKQNKYTHTRELTHRNTEKKITLEIEVQTMSMVASQYLPFYSAKEASNDVTTSLNLRFITTQKLALSWENITC